MKKNTSETKKANKNNRSKSSTKNQSNTLDKYFSKINTPNIIDSDDALSSTKGAMYKKQHNKEIITKDAMEHRTKRQLLYADETVTVLLPSPTKEVKKYCEKDTDSNLFITKSHHASAKITENHNQKHQRATFSKKQMYKDIDVEIDFTSSPKKKRKIELLKKSLPLCDVPNIDENLSENPNIFQLRTSQNLNEYQDSNHKENCIHTNEQNILDTIDVSANENPVLFKDDEVVVQFQSPKKFKLEDSYLKVQSPKKTKSNPTIAKINLVSNSEIHLMKNVTDVGQNEKISSTNSLSVDHLQKPIEGISFKNAVYSVCYEQFSKMYNCLDLNLIPPCSKDQHSCKQHHKDKVPEVMQSYLNGYFFNMFDGSLGSWEYDILNAVTLALSPTQFFRGDVLRVLFNYILNGPEEVVMNDVKDAMLRHIKIHPPCLEVLRSSYNQLLFERYNGDDFDFKQNITDEGILIHVLEKLEEAYIPKEDKDNNAEKESEDVEQSLVDFNNLVTTFEDLEERYDNLQPLREQEKQRVQDALNDMAEYNQLAKEKKLNEAESVKRLNIALQLIVILLLDDFQICVSKLKQCIDKERDEVCVPLVGKLMNKNLYVKVFDLYLKTLDPDLWRQLSKIIGLIAEYIHMFDSVSPTRWQYPMLNKECNLFADEFFSFFKKNDWKEEEEIERLRFLKPPWFQQRITMAVVNSRLSTNMGCDLKAIVDIINSNISCNNNKNHTNQVKDDCATVVVQNTNNLGDVNFLLKKTKFINHYGETYLHVLCKQTNLIRLETFLNFPEVDVNAKDNYGWSPLHEAVKSKSFALVKTKMLLQHQPLRGKKPVDASVQSKDGTTALHQAVLSGNLELCQCLVEYGGISLLRISDSNGVTPLDLSESRSKINEYFKNAIKTQEKTNLSAESKLLLSNYVIELLITASNASMSDHSTWTLYQYLKSKKQPSNTINPVQGIIVDKHVLLLHKEDQRQFSKLRNLLRYLAKNKNNPQSILLWNTYFK